MCTKRAVRVAVVANRHGCCMDSHTPRHAKSYTGHAAVHHLIVDVPASINNIANVPDRVHAGCERGTSIHARMRISHINAAYP